MRRFERLTLVAIASAGAIALFGSFAHAAETDQLYRERQCRPAPHNWQRHGSEFGELLLTNKLELRGNRLLWNDSPISKNTLQRYLTDVRHMKIKPGLDLVIGPIAKCADVIDVRRKIAATLKCGIEHACVEYSSKAWKSRQPPLRVRRKR